MIHSADVASFQAQVDATSAAIALGSQASDTDLSGQDLGGKILVAGVYFFTSSAQLTGTLTLDANNDANAVFIFQVSGSFTAANNAMITMINGGSSRNVFFLIGNSATVGTNASLMGTMIASSNITLSQGATVGGKALALTGEVSLNANAITNVAAPSPSPTPVPEEPTTFTLDCSFSSGAKKAPMSCDVQGLVCLDGSATACSAPENTINSKLNVSCSDGFTLDDQAATRSVNGSMVSMQAKDANLNEASIEISGFQAGTLSSSLTLTYASDGAQKTISGSCIVANSSPLKPRR